MTGVKKNKRERAAVRVSLPLYCVGPEILHMPPSFEVVSPSAQMRAAAR